MRVNDAFPSEYLAASDFNDPRLLVIRSVAMKEVKDRNTGLTNRKPFITFQGEEKGYLCNKTNFTIIAGIHGEESDNWTGKEVVLYSDIVRHPDGQMKPGIRVRAKRKPAAPAPMVPKPVEVDPALDDEIPF